MLSMGSGSDNGGGRLEPEPDRFTGADNPVSVPAEKMEEHDLLVFTCESDTLIPIKIGDLLQVTGLSQNTMRVIRRVRRAIIRSNTVEIDLASGIVKDRGAVVRLAAQEWDLIRVLSTKVDTLCDRDWLCRIIWGEEFMVEGRVTERERNILRLLVFRVRQKISARIESVSGVGYILVSNDNPLYEERESVKLNGREGVSKEAR